MEHMMQMKNAAIIDIDKKLNSKKMTLSPQTIVRYEAVKKNFHEKTVVMVGDSRRSIAYTTALSFWKGWYFVRKLVTWGLMVLRGLDIPEGEQGCFAKTRSWLNDEGVLLHAREWISGAEDKVTAYGLAKAVGEYLDSQRAEEAIQGALIYGPGGNKIRVRTARR
jgi:hypothetical protein